MTTVDGRVALVTGASRGLGAAIATALARTGFAVAIGCRTEVGAAERVRDTIVAAGGAAAVFRADVTDPDEVATMYAAVVATLGEVEVLVLNATGPQPDVPLAELTWPVMLAQLEFFVHSPMLLAQAVVPGMRRRGFGRIVSVGSEAFELGTPTSSAYVAAKGAQLGLTRSWARELGPDGITVNLVAPGFVPTERHVHVSQADKDAYASGVPLGRLGDPSDVGATVAFLAGPDAGFITGQRIAVNGGNTVT
jgi:3-oxoacyl-[acyl-carrier protein] reductase